MARTIRARLLNRSAILLALVLSGLQACSDESAAARDQDPVGREESAQEIIEKILAHCHGPRRGQLGKSSLQLTNESGFADLLSYAAPDKLRISGPQGKQSLVREDKAWVWQGNEDAKQASGSELENLILLRNLIGLLYLQPLSSPEGWEKAETGSLVKRSESGGTWRLEYQADLYEPTRLQGPGGSVTFLASTTGKTRIPTKADLAPLGTFQVKVMSAGQNFRADLFAIPSERSGDGTQLVLGRTSKPLQPEFQEISARKLLLIEDPEDWGLRRKNCNSIGRMLAAAGQSNAGDPLFFLEQGQERMAVPYKAARGKAGQEVTAAEGMEVRDLGVETVAVVYAPEGEFSERLRLGRQMLEDFLASNGIPAAGPMRMAINFYSSIDPAEPAARNQMPLRLEIPVSR